MKLFPKNVHEEGNKFQFGSFIGDHEALSDLFNLEFISENVFFFSKCKLSLALLLLEEMSLQQLVKCLQKFIILLSHIWARNHDSCLVVCVPKL